MVKKAQYKIMQMAFLVIGVFVFFGIVAIMFITFQTKDIRDNALLLQQEKAIAIAQNLADSPEFSCLGTSSCVDEDKLNALMNSVSKDYASFWQVSSIEVLIIYPTELEKKPCPNENCNFYLVFDSEKKISQKFSSYISLCKQVNSLEKDCKLAKLIVGVESD